MKKILSVSILAVLAVAPLSARAAAGDQTAGEITAKELDQDAHVATTSYVQGAYNAIATEHNKVVADITVSGVTGEGNHIGNNKSVAENLKTLNSAIMQIESTSVGQKQGGDYISANNTVAQDLKALDNAVGTVTTGNYIVQSTGVGTTKDMGENVQALDTAVGKVASSGTYNYLSATEGENAATISGNLQALDTAIGSMAGFNSQNYAKNTGSVAANITSLDTQAKTNADAIATINGNDQTSGSIAYAVKAEQDRAKAVEGELTNLNGTGVLATSGANASLVAAINAVANKVDTEASAAAVPSGTYIATTDTVSGALGKLDSQVTKNSTNLGATGTNGAMAVTTAAKTVQGAINELDSKVLTVYTDWTNSATKTTVDFTVPTAQQGEGV